MLSMKDTGLVEGVPLEPNKRPVLVRALGGFNDEDRKEVKTGEVVSCSEHFARYLLSIHRAERVVPVDVTPVAQQESEDEPEPEPEQEDPPTRKRGRRSTKVD
jgi:hypothetical protein